MFWSHVILCTLSLKEIAFCLFFCKYAKEVLHNWILWAPWWLLYPVLRWTNWGSFSWLKDKRVALGDVPEPGELWAATSPLSPRARGSPRMRLHQHIHLRRQRMDLSLRLGPLTLKAFRKSWAGPDPVFNLLLWLPGNERCSEITAWQVEKVHQRWPAKRGPAVKIMRVRCQSRSSPAHCWCNRGSPLCCSHAFPALWSWCWCPDSHSTQYCINLCGSTLF